MTSSPETLTAWSRTFVPDGWGVKTNDVASARAIILLWV